MTIDSGSRSCCLSAWLVRKEDPHTSSYTAMLHGTFRSTPTEIHSVLIATVHNLSDTDVVEKRLAPIAIALIKVIGGQLLAGAAKIAVDATKAHLEVEKADFNNFDDFSTSYDCFEIKSGTAINKGDGGFINAVPVAKITGSRGTIVQFKRQS
ncbi:hypothetical protein IG631_11297 [Alternaria alternata]|nr:hypothetical protein IG631_11297 [Alternaria alternata]